MENGERALSATVSTASIICRPSKVPLLSAPALALAAVQTGMLQTRQVSLL